MDEALMRSRFAAAEVARLATVAPDGSPHVVPVTFAVVGEAVVFAVDHKPKTTTRLQRLRNIGREPRVSFLVDHYEPDWAALWWVRADALAEVLTEGTRREQAVDALAIRYPDYRAVRPSGPIVWGAVTRWSGWSAR